MLLQKPVKINIVNTDGKTAVDYELAGKILDNMILEAQEHKSDLVTEGGDFTIGFSIGKKYEYSANLRILKSYITFDIKYLRDIPKSDVKKIKGMLPKDKKLVEEAEAKRKTAEKEKTANAKKK